MYQPPYQSRQKCSHYNYEQYIKQNKIDNLYKIQQFIKNINHTLINPNKFLFNCNSIPTSVFFNKNHHLKFEEANLYQKIINLIKINQFDKKIFINNHFNQSKNYSIHNKQPLLYLNNFIQSTSKIHTPINQHKQISTSTITTHQTPIKHIIHHQNYQSKYQKQTTRYNKYEKNSCFRAGSARIQSQQSQRCPISINRTSHHTNPKLSLASRQPPSTTTLQPNKQPRKQPTSTLVKHEPHEPPPKITAKYYLIYQITQQPSTKSKIIPHLSYNSKVRTQVASLTKIMTCIIAIEICERYHLDPKNQLIKIGKYQASIGGTSANLEVNDVYTLHDLLHGLMLPSGNDASLAIAVWGGRKMIEEKEKQRTQQSPLKKKLKKQYYQRYIQQMNQKTIQLKMTKTNYANTHGLTNLFNRSCAHDLALLSFHCMKNEYFKNIVACQIYQNVILVQKCYQSTNTSIVLHSNDSINGYITHSQDIKISNNCNDTKSNTQQTTFSTPPPPCFEISHKKIYWENTHKLLQKKSKQYIGIKTGLTTTAGSCLCSCVRTECGKYLLIIVLNCRKLHQRFKETEVLRKWVYRKLGISNPGKDAGKAVDVESESSVEENQSEMFEGHDQAHDVNC